MTKNIMAPVIGISGGIFVDTKEVYPSIEKACVNNGYVNSVLKAGGVPVVIPLSEDKDVIRQQVSLIDGLVMSGGCDVSPLLYGEEPHEKMRRFSPARDAFDFAVLQSAEARKIPVFAICRGIQVVNVYHGGTLNQDNSLQEGCYIKHNQGHLFDTASHTVDIEDGSWLHDIIGHEYAVNSFHHQSVKRVAAGFAVTARARDGIIEAIERTSGSFCVCVQWHPETMSGRDDKMLALFKAFIDKCKGN